MSEAVLEKSKAASFSDRTVAILNDAALALMISVGHRTGLFDTMATLPPATVEDLAKTAGLNARYVREWLAAVVTGGIVEYDAGAGTYRLPAEHAACLTRAASPNNVAVTAQWLAVLGGSEDAVVDAFRHGRGVPYTAYRRFHAVMEEESLQTVVAGLVSHILPLVDGLVDQLRSGIDVLDIACGSGRAIITLAEMFPLSRFAGVDVSAEAIGAGRSGVAARQLCNVTLVQADAADLWVEESYHLVTAFDAIHDQACPQRVLEQIHAALRPGGVFLMQDVAGRTKLEDNLTHPLAPFNYTISCMHCMSVSLAAGGPGLGAMWGREQALEMLAAAGFESIRVESLPHDQINDYYVAVKPS
jgi:ubiquinone/menaquinone biosynthesis C-methylase UbiE